MIRDETDTPQEEQDKILNILSTQYDEMDSFSEKISDSIHSYKSESRDINNYLRRGFTDEVGFVRENVLIDVANIDEAFSKITPLTEKIVVYRGTRTFKKDNPIDTKQYTSTSYSLMVANHSFASKECCIFEITVMNGSKVLPLYIYNQNDEKEILLDRNGIFKILDEKIYRETWYSHSPDEKIKQRIYRGVYYPNIESIETY